MLGISFRPRQLEAFGLDQRTTLEVLLAYPFQLIRLGAYWDRVEPTPGAFETKELDWQLDAAERAGKQVILSVGPIKNFGYPEFYVPRHRLERPLKEGSLVTPATHADLLAAARDFVAELVSRYRDRTSVVAWQLEHEAVDPLGLEHSWRLSLDFVRAELESLKAADPIRPVLMNGYLPTSSVVRLSQWWRTRHQGDSLALAAQLADIVGVDYYPKHALFALGRRTLYMDAAGLPWQKDFKGKRWMVTEGQAEPWEAVTVAPNPRGRTMFSCGPADLIRNYNTAMRSSGESSPVHSYLFWGAEYWVLRERTGDPSYLFTFERILDQSG